MRIQSTCGLVLALLLALLACTEVQSQDVLKGKVRWEWILFDSKGKELRKGTFMGYVTGEIKHGKEQNVIGSWKKVNETEVHVMLAWKEGKLEGTGELKLAKEQPVTFEGTITHKDGKKKEKDKLVIVMIKD